MSDKLHVFLVEDDDDMALLMRRALERSGYRVTTCHSATDALIVLGTTSFDLVLLDNQLPDMAGVDLLRAISDEGITIPVLMVTGYGDEQLATRVLRAGALDYLVKDIGRNFLNELPKRVADCYAGFQLQQTNRILIEALESAQDGVMITDVQGIITHVNQALEKMTGYQRGELLGQTPRILKSGVHRADVYEELWRTILARDSWHGELTNRRKDGSEYEVSVSISPIVDSHGRLTHFVGIQRDVSGIKQLQQQLLQAQKMQSVGTLAGGIAHEFNNLLAGISGYAALGMRDCPQETFREFFRHIADLGERAASLTRQMLAFGRRATLSQQPVQLDELLRSTIGLLGRTLRHELRLEVDGQRGNNTPLIAEADSAQLQQVLINLIINARDATPETGTITLALRHEVVSQDRPAYPEMIRVGDYAVIEVADTGCGMDSQVLEQALDPFYTTKDIGKGTGLGLPLVYGIVRAHNGYLDIQTQPGSGTRVSLYLPRFSRNEPRAETSHDSFSHVLEPEPGPGRQILVIDDEPAVQEVVRRFLEIAGHRVICASSTTEGLAVLSHASPAIDLVLLDWLVPREDGFQNLKRLQKAQPGLPIVILSGYLPDDLAEVLLAEGVATILRKPFRMNELWYAVNKVLWSPGADASGSQLRKLSIRQLHLNDPV